MALPIPNINATETSSVNPYSNQLTTTAPFTMNNTPVYNVQLASPGASLTATTPTANNLTPGMLSSVFGSNWTAYAIVALAIIAFLFLHKKGKI